MVTTIGVIGAGQMGSGIAQVSAMSGYKTLLWDVSEAGLEKGIKGIHSHLDKMVEKGKLSPSDAEKAKSTLYPAKETKEFSSCDMVVEAATENFSIKDIFRIGYNR